MKKGWWRFLSVLLVLAVVSMACNLPNLRRGSSDNGQPVDAPIQSVTLGVEVRSEQGGFLIKQPIDYEVYDFWGFVVMEAPEADPDLGPFIMMYGGLVDQPKTIDQMIAEFLGEGDFEADEVEIVSRKAGKVGGVTAELVELRGKVEGKEVAARGVFSMVNPQQEFFMVGIAPLAGFEKEFGPLFDSMVASVSFFEPTELSFDDTDFDFDFDFEDPPTPGEIIYQWAYYAEASSEYGNPSWGAIQATGEPDTFECGDFITAWASEGTTEVEWLDLYYQTPVVPTEINVFQSYNPGFVTEIYIYDKDDGEYLVYSASASAIDICPDVLYVPVETSVMTSRIRVVVDQTELYSWAEIDAVELVGYAGEGDSFWPDPIRQTNPEDIPIFPLAEGVDIMDDFIFYTVEADVQTVVEFYFDELIGLGWSLDIGDNGTCFDAFRCIGEYQDYEDPDNFTWGFILGESEFLMLTVMSVGGSSYVSISF
jgi:hypothetical protein